MNQDNNFGNGGALFASRGTKLAAVLGEKMIYDCSSVSVSLTEGKDNSQCLEGLPYVIKNLSIILKRILPINSY